MIGTIGQPGHGSRTLTAAITSVLAKQGNARAWTHAELTNVPLSFRSSHVEYETANRHYAHQDWAAQRDYTRDVITGAAQVDGLILIVSVADGTSKQNHDDVRLARQVGVSSIVVFLNKADMVDDRELLGVVELEARDLLKQCGFAGDEAPVIVGSALKALEGDVSEIGEPAILRLLDAVDAAIPTPPRDVDLPVLLPIEDVFNIKGRGIIAAGRVERGVMNVGDTVEIVGMREEVMTATIRALEMFRKPLTTAQAGDNVGITLSGVDVGDLVRGQVLAQPASIGAFVKFEAVAYFMKPEAGGRATPIGPEFRPHFYFRTTDVDGRLEFVEGAVEVMLGEVVRIVGLLNTPIAMERGLRFAMRERGKAVGAGTILRILANQ